MYSRFRSIFEIQVGQLRSLIINWLKLGFIYLTKIKNHQKELTKIFLENKVSIIKVALINYKL